MLSEKMFMSANKSNNEKIDEMLRRALHRHTEPVPTDFTDKLLTQLREAEEQRILARVIIEERLAIAGCVAVAIIAIVAALVFPSIAESFTNQIEAFVHKMSEAVEAVSRPWLFHTAFAGALAFAVYSLVDLLAGDS